MDYIYELRANVKMNGKGYTIREGFFSSVDAVYKYLLRVGVPTIVGQNFNTEETIKKGMINNEKIRVIIPSFTDEETGVFVDERANYYVMFTYNVIE